MISRLWNQFPLQIPTDGQLIWCRIDRWSGAPFAGKYSSADGTITSLINGIVYPQWVVSAWRNADPPISLPTNPIVGMIGADSTSRIQQISTSDWLHRPRFDYGSSTEDVADFAALISYAYLPSSDPTPPFQDFTPDLRINLVAATGPDYWWPGTYNNSRGIGPIISNLFIPNPPTYDAANNFCIQIKTIYLPFGYIYPPVFARIDATS